MPTTKTNRLLALEKTLNFSGGQSSKQSSKRSSLNRKRRKGKRRGNTSSTRQGKTQVKAQAFDYDEPIELTYRDDIGSYAPAMAYETDEDDYEEESYEASAFDWDDDEYDDENDYEETAYEASAFEWDDDEGDDDESDAFEVEAFEVDEEEEKEDSYRESQSFSQLALDEDELAEDLDFSDLDAALDEAEVSQPLSETDFAKDLQAIMTGEKTYDKDRGGMVSADDELATAKSQVADAPLVTDESNNPHDVFSQMSEHMPHNQMEKVAPGSANDRYADSHSVFNAMDMSQANAFDLGSISLEQMFDESDEAMDQEAKYRPQSRAKSLGSSNKSETQESSVLLALDEVALSEDVAWMQKETTEETEPEANSNTDKKTTSEEDSGTKKHEKQEIEQSVLTQENSVKN